MKKEIILTTAIVVLMCLIAYMGYRCGVATASCYQTERDTITYVDTIQYYRPLPKDSAVIKYETRYLPVSGQRTDTFFLGNYAKNNGDNIPPQEMSDDSDSIAVEIPITQKKYETKDYLAYVSGYEPQLDSIFVFPRTSVIHSRTNKPPNRWNVGITAGCGYGLFRKNADVFLGIGISYRLW